SPGRRNVDRRGQSLEPAQAMNSHEPPGLPRRLALAFHSLCRVTHRPMRYFPMTKLCLLAAGGVLVALVAFLTTPARSDGQGKPGEPRKAAPTRDSKRVADDAAIRKASADFVKAVEAGDAKAVGGSWTEEGEYIGDDGTTIRGRAAIEAAYAKAFAKHK